MEHTLRARIRAGDPDAFGTLFDEHSRAVYNLAFRLTGSWTAAEESVSLTFLEAWRLRARVEPAGGSLRPWLLGITVNVTRNHIRAVRRHRAAISRLPPPPPVPDFADELAGQLDIKVGTVRSRLSRARSKLRTLAGESAERESADQEREPLAAREQEEGDRENAAQPMQEEAR
jgi:RNA polymerase sigma-70 factor (ECF subfamily)